jgi:putative sporulation protein YtaF
MHLIFFILVIGISANLDNLGVGLAYGVRQVAIPPLANLVISMISLIIGCISVWIGTFINSFLSAHLASLIGAALLIIIGIWIMFSKKNLSPITHSSGNNPIATCSEIAQEPKTYPGHYFFTISKSETGMLGIALSMNVMTNGISAGLWKLGILSTSLTMAAFSYITIMMGTWIGSRYGTRWLGNLASYTAGFLLIFIGLHQLS